MGLNAATGSARNPSISPESDTLLGVFTHEGKSAVVFRTGTDTFVSVHTGATLALGSVDAIALAFGKDQVALVTIRAGVGQVQTGLVTSAAAAATPIPATITAGDLAAAYGPEGWLYAASRGAIQRLNPASSTWEATGTYGGQARQMVRARNGALLLLTTAGVWRREHDVAWAQVWIGGADGISTYADRAALAWSAPGGAGGWYVAVSEDAGATWGTAEQAAYADFGGEPAYGHAGDGGAYPVLAQDTRLEVVGLFRQPAGDLGERAGLPGGNDVVDPTRMPGAGRSAAYATVVRRTADGWFPRVGSRVPEGLVGTLRDSLPGQGFRCAQSQGPAVCAWEAIQLNGSTDVFIVTR